MLIEQAPDLGSGPVWAMDYVADRGINLRMVQDSSIDPPREMTDAEVEVARELLEDLTRPAIHCREHWSTGGDC